MTSPAPVPSRSSPGQGQGGPAVSLPTAGPATFRSVALAVAAERGVGFRTMMSRDRRKAVSWARQEAMSRCRDLPGASLWALGVFFERDHTTVLHGIRAARARAGGAHD